MTEAPTAKPSPRRVRLILAGGAVLLAILLAWSFSPVTIHWQTSAAMAPTLGSGDLVAVRGARAFCGRQKPKPGDVVLARAGGRRLLRVAAGTRASVELRDGVLVVNGRPAQPVRQGKVVRETLANEATYQTQDLGYFRAGDNFGPVRVPGASWFLLGDNRDEAQDSRELGVVAQSDVCGVAYRVLYSRDAKRIGRRP